MPLIVRVGCCVQQVYCGWIDIYVFFARVLCGQYLTKVTETAWKSCI